MPNAVIYQHVPGEGPGRIGNLLTQRGFTLSIRHLYLGETLHVDRHDVLVVMGGPMGVGDLHDSRWPFLAQEVVVLRERIHHDAPTLGVCLGAQLLAHAAEARVQPNRNAAGQAVLEVGWEPVHFELSHPRVQTITQGLRSAEWMLHWHGDTFELPREAIRIGMTPRCANQGFLLKKHLCGLQFHPEVSAEQIAEWVDGDAEYVLRANGPNGAADILADTQRLMPEHLGIGNRFVNNLLDQLLA